MEEKIISIMPLLQLKTASQALTIPLFVIGLVSGYYLKKYITQAKERAESIFSY